MWQIGIIGAGSYGEQHADALAEIANCKLVAASRTNPQKLKHFTKRYDCVGYTDYRDLLKNPDIDIVAIATPHHLHTEVVMAAAKASKHILLEKPLAPMYDECELIVRTVSEAEITFMIGHVNHFVPAYRVAKQIIESGEMGKPVLGLATMQRYWMTDNRRDWHLTPETGGGVWLTLGIHPLERMTWLINSPISTVSSQLGTHFHQQDADDSGMVFVRYENGAAGCIVSNGYKTGAPKHLTELTFTKGMMNIDYEAGVSIGKNEKWQTIPESLPNGDWMHEALVEEWTRFIDAVENKSSVPVNSDFVLHIMDVLFTALRSSKEQRELDITTTWEI